MKVTAKNVALSTLEAAKESNIKLVAQGLFRWLKVNNAIKLLPLILLEIDKIAEAEGLVMATATSARAMSVDQKSQIIQKIKTVSGAKEVNLENKIDPRIIGGVKINFGDKVIDLTVRHKLDKLRMALNGETNG